MKTGDPLGSFLNGDFGHFEQYEEDFEELLTKISRDLPAEVYRELREQLIDFFPSILRGLKTSVKLVVDSNIIVKDAFRVAQGKPSSTDRLLSSEFVDLFAPSEITGEVQRDVETDIPPNASISIAKGHARKLLEKVKKVPHTRSDALAKVPGWVWALVAAAGIGVLVGAVLDEGFRKSVTDTISTALESVAKTLDSIAQGVRWIWKAAVEVLSMLWTLLGPVFDFMVLIAGVLVRRIALMLAQIIQLSAPE